MKKSIIAGASVLALAGAVMPMAGVFAAGEPSIQDTITVEISPSCTFTSTGGAVPTDDSYSYTGTNKDGGVNLINSNNSNQHSFNVFCNNNSGYHVTAAATALSGTTAAAADSFAYKATLPTASSEAATKATGAWNAAMDGAGVVGQLADGGASTTIVSRDEASGADGENFTATYTAWIGTESPADTYSGNITYTLYTGV